VYGWAGNAARMGKCKARTKVLSGELNGRGFMRGVWEDNIKNDFREKQSAADFWGESGLE